MPEPRCYCWNDLAEDAPMPLLKRRRVIGEQAMISQVRLDKGCFVPAHSHANEQFCCVLEGCLRFGLGQEGTAEYQEVEVPAGQVLHLPSGVLHSASAVQDTLVLDIFSPPSATTGIDRSS